MADFGVAGLREVIARCLNNSDVREVDEATLDTPFVELGIDSLSFYEIAVYVNDTHRVDIPDDDLDGLDTPRKFVAYVDARLAVAT